MPTIKPTFVCMDNERKVFVEQAIVDLDDNFNQGLKTKEGGKTFGLDEIVLLGDMVQQGFAGWDENGPYTARSLYMLILKYDSFPAGTRLLWVPSKAECSEDGVYSTTYIPLGLKAKKRD